MKPMFDVTSFGSHGDGKTLDTAAVQAAIDAAAKEGGTVLVPPGTYLCGTIHLRSRVTLHLAQGATILGSPNLSDYVAHSWGHHDDRTPFHLIFAEDESHIAITGEGTIDGNGQHFKKDTRKHDWAFYAEIPMRPSPMVEISRCTDLRIENIHLTRPGGWTLHLHDCDRAVIHGITINNSIFWPNSDGIDLTGCQDTMISNCFIHTGDDAIALKTTIDSRACERITVTNCILETACAAIRLGFESDQDFRHCAFSNIAIRNCSRGIDLLTFAGGNIENCTFTNITGRCMSGWILDRPIEVFSSFTNEPYKVRIEEHPNFGKRYDDRPPGKIRGITMTNIDLETCGRVLMAAAPDGVVEDITLDHIRLHYPMLDDPMPIGPRVGGKGFFEGTVHDDFRGARAAMVLQNLRDVRIRDARVQWPTYPVNPDAVELLRSENRMGNPDYYRNLDAVISGESAPAFHALWARGVEGVFDPHGLSASAVGTAPLLLDHCDFRML